MHTAMKYENNLQNLIYSLKIYYRNPWLDFQHAFTIYLFILYHLTSE